MKAVGGSRKTREIEKQVTALRLQLSEKDAVSARQKAEYEEQLAALQAQLYERNELYTTEKARADALTIEMSNLEDDLNSSYNSTLDQLINQISHLEAQLSAKNDSANDTPGGGGSRINSEHRVDELELELSELRQQLERREEEIEFAEEKYREQATQIEELNEEMEEMEDHLNSTYKDSLQLMVQQIEELKARLAESSSNQQSFQQSPVKSKEIVDQLSALKKELAEKDAQLQEVTEEMEEMEDHLNKSYSESLDQMVKQISDLKSMLVRANTENEALRQKFSASKQVNPANDERVQQLEVVVAAKEEKIKAHQAEMELMENQLNTSYSDTLDQMVKQISQLKDLLDQSNKENEVLKRDRSTPGSESGSDERVRELEQQVNVLNQEVYAKDEKLKEISDEMKALEDQLNESYANTLDQMVTKMSELKNLLAASNKEIAALKEQVALNGQANGASIERIGELEAHLSAKDERIKALGMEMEEMEDQLNKSYSETLDQMVKQISDLKVLLDTSNGELQALKKNASTNGQANRNDEEKVKELEARLASKEKEIKSLGVEMEEKEEQLNNSYSDTLDQMVKQVSWLKSRLADSNSEVEALKRNASADEEAKQGLEDSLENISAQLQTAMTQISKLKTDLADSVEEAEKLKRAASPSEQEEVTAMDKMAETDSQVVALKRDFNERGEKIQELRLFLAKAEASAEKTDDSQGVDGFVRKISNLESLLSDSKKANDTNVLELEKELQTVKIQLAAKEAELRATKSSLEEQKDEAEQMEVQVTVLENILNGTTGTSQPDAENGRDCSQPEDSKPRAILVQSEVDNTRDDIESLGDDSSEEAWEDLDGAYSRHTEEGKGFRNKRPLPRDTCQRQKNCLNKIQTQFSTLKAQLALRDEKLRLSSEKCDEQADQIEQLSRGKATEDELNKSFNLSLDNMVKEIADLKDRLKESSEAAESFQQQATQALAEKEKDEARIIEFEAQLEAMQKTFEQQSSEIQIKTAGIQTQLVESSSVTSKFHLTRDADESRIYQLEQEITILRAKVDQQKTESDARKKDYDEKVAEIAELFEKATAIECDLHIANEVRDFLKAGLTRSDFEKEENAERAKKVETQLEELKIQIKKQAEKIADLEFRLFESDRLSENMKSDLTKTKQAKVESDTIARKATDQLNAVESMLKERDSELAEKGFRLAEADRLLKFVRSSLDKTKAEKSDLEVRRNEEKAFGESTTQGIADKLAAVEVDLNEKGSQLTEKGIHLEETDRFLKIAQNELTKVKAEKSEMETVLIAEKASVAATLQSEISKKEFRIAETNRVLAFVQANLTKVKAEQEKTENELERKIAKLEFSLSEANRVAHFLQSTVERIEKDKATFMSLSEELEASLSATQAQLDLRESEIAFMEEAIREKDLQIADFDQQIADIESRLIVANRVTEHLTENLAETQDAKRANDEKSSVAAGELALLKQKLRQAEETIAETEARLRETEGILLFSQMELAKIQRENDALENKLEGEVMQKEFRITEASRVLAAVQNTLTKTTEEKEKTENKLMGRIVDLEFRLQESNRVATFLERSASKIGDEKRVSEKKVRELSKQLTDLKAKFGGGRDETGETLDGKVGGDELLRKRIRDLESKLVVSKNLTQILQGSLSRTEETKRSKEEEISELREQLTALQSQIAELESSRAESTKLATYLEERVALAESENRFLTDKAERLEQEMVSLKSGGTIPRTLF